MCRRLGGRRFQLLRVRPATTDHLSCCIVLPKASRYFGLHTATKWPYERSCLSDSECQFGKQCDSLRGILKKACGRSGPCRLLGENSGFSPSSYGCPSFFSQDRLVPRLACWISLVCWMEEELDEISTFSDALRACCPALPMATSSLASSNQDRFPAWLMIHVLSAR